MPSVDQLTKLRHLISGEPENPYPHLSRYKMLQQVARDAGIQAEGALLAELGKAIYVDRISPDLVQIWAQDALLDQGDQTVDELAAKVRWRRQRLSQRLSMKGAAAQVGITRSTLYRWLERAEAGEYPYTLMLEDDGDDGTNRRIDLN